MGMESVMGTADLWPHLLALTAIPALFQLFTLPLCAESPKYLLIIKKKEVKAQKGIFSTLRNTYSLSIILFQI